MRKKHPLKLSERWFLIRRWVGKWDKERRQLITGLFLSKLPCGQLEIDSAVEVWELIHNLHFKVVYSRGQGVELFIYQYQLVHCPHAHWLRASSGSVHSLVHASCQVSKHSGLWAPEKALRPMQTEVPRFKVRAGHWQDLLSPWSSFYRWVNWNVEVKQFPRWHTANKWHR